MWRFRTGAVLAVALVGVVAAGAAVTLNAQKKTGAVIVAEPRVVAGFPLSVVADGADQVATIFAGGPQIGIQIRNIAEDEVAKLKLPSASGVVVESVTSGSPAEKAGVKAGDVITEFDGERVRSSAQLTRLVRESAEGRVAKIVVFRDGKRIELNVTPGAASSLSWKIPWTIQSEEAPKRAEELRKQLLEDIRPRLEREYRDPEGRVFRFTPRGDLGGGALSLLFEPAGRGRLGIGVEDLTEQLASYFGAKDGVLVRSVDDGSPAAKTGIKAGDVITSIDGDAVKDVEALLGRLNKIEGAAEVTIGLVRDRKPLTLKAKLEAREPVRRWLGRSVWPII